MSTEYKITEDISAHESSSCISLGIDMGDGSGMSEFSTYMNEVEFRMAIIKQIEVLSYISDDPEEVLKRFNVDYGETV
jgi:hypothetical protein